MFAKSKRWRASGQGGATNKQNATRAARLQKMPTCWPSKNTCADATGLVVSIDHREDHGTLTIRYGNLEQLDDLVQRLVRGQ